MGRYPVANYKLLVDFQLYFRQISITHVPESLIVEQSDSGLPTRSHFFFQELQKADLILRAYAWRIH